MKKAVYCIYLLLVSTLGEASTTVWKSIEAVGVSGDAYSSGSLYMSNDRALSHLQSFQCAEIKDQTKIRDRCEIVDEGGSRVYRFCKTVIIAICAYKFNEDMDPVLYQAIREGYLSGKDSLEHAVKVATLARQNIIDGGAYLEVRSGPKKGKDTYEQAGRIALDVKNDVIDLNIYLDVREGPRNGVQSHDNAYEAAAAVKRNELNAKCYLMKVKGPYFGLLEHKEAMSLCRNRQSFYNESHVESSNSASVQ